MVAAATPDPEDLARPAEGEARVAMAQGAAGLAGASASGHAPNAADGIAPLLSHPALWRGSAVGREARVLPTGFPELDALLPDGGWPAAGLVEVVAEGGPVPGGEALGLGAVSLFLHAAAQRSHEGRRVAFVAPPFVPYAPALSRAGLALSHVVVVRPPEPAPRSAAPTTAGQGGPGSGATAAGIAGPDSLWVLEQLLAEPACGLVLGWVPPRCSDVSLRRLKLAAARGGSLGVLFRPPAALAEASPAQLRLKLTAASSAVGDQRLGIELRKAQGSFRLGRCTVTLWPYLEHAAYRPPLPPESTRASQAQKAQAQTDQTRTRSTPANSTPANSNLASSTMASSARTKQAPEKPAPEKPDLAKQTPANRTLAEPTRHGP